MTRTEQAFVAAYDKYSDDLFRYCLFKVDNREIAKDIVQETFTKTWDYLVRGGEIKRMKPFLYKSLRNLIIDHYRTKKNLSLDSLQEESHFDPVAPVTVSPEDRFDGELALAFLKHIPAEYREVIVLRLVQDLSFKEIALITKEKKNTVAVRFHRGIKKIREIFNHENQS